MKCTCTSFVTLGYTSMIMDIRSTEDAGYLRAILVYIECSVKINYEIVDTPHVHAQRFFNMAIIQQEQI